MPERITKNKSGGYKVTGPHGTHAKDTTKQKAEAQVRLLNAIEHGFKPTGKVAQGGTKGNKSGGEMGDFHSKRSKKG